VTLAHWDEAPSRRIDSGAFGGVWTNLGAAAGSVTVGVQRIQLDEGEISTHAHVHGADEEIFFVLGGGGLSWQDGKTHEIRAGDCLVHRPLAEAHTLRAGQDGLDVLAFGGRTPVGGGHLTAIGTRWLRPGFADTVDGDDPLEREHGIEWPEPSLRPSSIVNRDDVEGDYGGMWKRLGRTAGAQESGLNYALLPPDEEGASPHCHSVEEEIYVVLEGVGTLELWGRPRPGEPLQTEPEQTHALRAGHVVARPAGTGVSACLRTGDSAMTYLAYGTRSTADTIYYPRSNKVFFRGLGVIARLELLEYADGEPG
jgi:uncharacterized cupin superfamily protein